MDEAQQILQEAERASTSCGQCFEARDTLPERRHSIAERNRLRTWSSSGESPGEKIRVRDRAGPGVAQEVHGDSEAVAGRCDETSSATIGTAKPPSPARRSGTIQVAGKDREADKWRWKSGTTGRGFTAGDLARIFDSVFPTNQREWERGGRHCVSVVREHGGRSVLAPPQGERPSRSSAGRGCNFAGRPAY